VSREAGGEDFASAAMMRLVAAGLARQGIAVPLRPGPGARVQRADKRAVLDHVLARHGPRALLAIADAAPEMPPEPVVQALTRARSPADLFERWRRLERFSHARHSVQAAPAGGAAFRLTHAARDGGPPPSRAETLLVLGVLAVLAEITISGPVTLAADAGAIWRRGGVWSRRAGEPAGGSVLLTLAPAGPAAPHGAARAEGDPVCQLRDLLAADPLRRWSLAALAAEAAVSARTLQRRLAARSLSFSRMVADARLQVAASCLCDPQGPGLAEIGFLAGYADQAHFARSFRRAVGTTPGAYRTDFRPAPVA
jgi:AraC-like DNA-binding protein